MDSIKQFWKQYADPMTTVFVLVVTVASCAFSIYFRRYS